MTTIVTMIASAHHAARASRTNLVASPCVTMKCNYSCLPCPTLNRNICSCTYSPFTRKGMVGGLESMEAPVHVLPL